MLWGHRKTSNYPTQLIYATWHCCHIEMNSKLAPATEYIKLRHQTTLQYIVALLACPSVHSSNRSHKLRNGCHGDGTEIILHRHTEKMLTSMCYMTKFRIITTIMALER